MTTEARKANADHLNKHLDSINFEFLTIEYGQGATYRNNLPTLYAHSTYGPSSVNAGMPMRTWIDNFESDAHADEVIALLDTKPDDLRPNNGTTYTPYR